MQKIQQYKSIILITIAALAGGGIPVFSKIALRTIPPLPFTLIRFILASIILLIILLLQKQKLTLKGFKELIPVSILGSMNVTLFVFGVRWTTASSSQMLYTFAPLLAALASYFLLKERFSSRKIVGILAGFLGSLIIIILPVLSGKSSINGSIAGNLIIFIAVISFSFYSVFSKHYQKKYQPLQITLAFALTTVVIQTILSPFTFHNATWVHSISAATIWSSLYVGIIGAGIYYYVYQLAIKNATPVVATMVLYLQPIFTILWAVGMLNEKLSLWFIIGSLLAFAGIILVTSKDNNKGVI